MPGDIESKSAYLIYLRHLFAYHVASEQCDNQQRVLEYGFGEGYGSKYLEEYVLSMDCIDISESMVAHAGSKYGSNKLHYHHFDGKTIPFEDEYFDLAISFQVIEHIPDVEGYLKEFYRVLKRGGKLLITTPNRVYRLKPGQQPWNKYHLREYDQFQLKDELSKVFKNNAVEGITASGEAYEFEIERGRKARASKERDPLGLRKLIPGFALRMIKGKSVPDSDLSFKKKFGLADYFVEAQNVEPTLDLLGICIKD